MWLRDLLPWRKCKGFSTTHCRLRLPICANTHLSSTIRTALTSRHLPSLPLNFLAPQIPLSSRTRIVPPLCLLPIHLPKLLDSAQLILGLLPIRRKSYLWKALFNPFNPRLQIRTHLIHRYLSPLNQWSMTQTQSGPHSAVRNRQSSLAIPYATLLKVEEDQVLPSDSVPGSSQSPRKPLIRDRPQTSYMEMSSNYLAQINETPEKD